MHRDRRTQRASAAPVCPRIAALAIAAGLLCGTGPSLAQAVETVGVAPPGPESAPPIVLRAQSVTGHPDLDAVAQGGVEFRRGDVAISADRLSYQQADDLATATGHVRIRRGGAVYTGPELQLQVQRFKGYFLDPEFEFTQIGAGGHADRVDFLDSARAVATNASYTSCPRDGSGAPDWVLEARSVKLDLDANEGIAQGAKLRFMGVPILALPAMSFPLTDARKSGWLPPTVNLDSRSGLEVSVPYYWNIAPNRDATIAPRVITRRGLGVDTEFRYLEPSYGGSLNLSLLPHDQIANRAREAMLWSHDSELAHGLRFSAAVVRVSDDGWWKDFPDATHSLTPRLLASRASLERPFAFAGGGSGLVYARTQRWQVLQGSDALVTAPYERNPQVGLQLRSQRDDGLDIGFETEVNHFILPDNNADPARPTGLRWHALGSISRPWREPGGWLVPKVSFNAAAYRTDQPMADGRRSASRVIPTLSLDAGLSFERRTQAFGRTLRQTLEPRLLYVDTPYRDQSRLPNFDSAAKDFNFASIYSENAFSGVDRVSDAHQLTAGVTSRLVDAVTGAEALRLGIVQRYLFSDQRVAPQPDGSPDGPPLTQRLSDLLLLGSTSLLPHWTLDGTLQYSPDTSRLSRSILGMRYSPGPYRTLSATYRLTRGLSEQLELGWQWPVYTGKPRAGSNSCTGSWYAVGRVNYSMMDRRITDSIVGAEYDAGCWIGRFVAERLSTGLSEATTRVLFQLELVGLSRLGSNPLQVLKDNIPGYQLLSGRRPEPSAPDAP
jgi:LPS-assembly protein